MLRSRTVSNNRVCGSRLRAGAAAWLLVAAVCAAVCLSTCAGRQTAGKNGFSNTFKSVDALGRAVLSLVHDRDRAGLEAITISEHEYRTIIWPQLPISKIEQWREHYDFVWGQHTTKSTACLASMLSGYGGRTCELIEVRVRDGITEYETFRVHRDARLIVRNENGERKVLNLFGSIIEMNGRFKIMSYNTH